MWLTRASNVFYGGYQRIRIHSQSRQPPSLPSLSLNNYHVLRQPCARLLFPLLPPRPGLPSALRQPLPHQERCRRWARRLFLSYDRRRHRHNRARRARPPHLHRHSVSVQSERVGRAQAHLQACPRGDSRAPRCPQLCVSTWPQSRASRPTHAAPRRGRQSSTRTPRCRPVAILWLLRATRILYLLAASLLAIASPRLESCTAQPSAASRASRLPLLSRLSSRLGTAT
ncbi:hypothetical protein FB451DRAFT_1267248 [Mycena latifolia]|nr:hypothetical protein FB451DRAFT_1267248 [Mycena latifolia]